MDELTQIHGFVVLMDFTGMTMKHMGFHGMNKMKRNAGILSVSMIHPTIIHITIVYNAVQSSSRAIRGKACQQRAGDPEFRRCAL